MSKLVNRPPTKVSEYKQCNYLSESSDVTLSGEGKPFYYYFII